MGKTAHWIVPTGGGGLISALGAILNKLKPRPKLIGVQAAASPFTHSLYHRHTQAGIQDLPTLADGLSGAVENGSVTIPMIEEFADDFLLVSEEEIARSIAFAWYVYHEKIEGSGAVGLAAVLAGKVKERPSVVVITGGNIESDVHENIIARFAGEKWD
jgi:threonine dehydratase